MQVFINGLDLLPCRKKKLNLDRRPLILKGGEEEEEEED